jgi:hypothetical protein
MNYFQNTAETSLLFSFELINQIDGIVKTNALTFVNGGHTHGVGKCVFPVSMPPTDQDQIIGFLHKGGAGQLLNQWLR